MPFLCKFDKISHDAIVDNFELPQNIGGSGVTNVKELIPKAFFQPNSKAYIFAHG